MRQDEWYVLSLPFDTISPVANRAHSTNGVVSNVDDSMFCGLELYTTTSYD